MKTIALVSLLPLAALAHPQGLWWGTDTCYTSPDNTDNQCSEQQKTGFNWSDLADGLFSSYAGFAFTGFTCTAAGSASAALGAHFSSSKSISGKLVVGGSSSLRMSVGGGAYEGVDISAFSISSFRLSTSVEADVQLVYGMPDGSSCRDVAACSSQGTHVSNEQCGGAVSVGFELAAGAEIEECDLGIHQIDFDCEEGSKTPGGGHEGGHEGHSTSPVPVPVPVSTPSPSGVSPNPSTSVAVIPPPVVSSPHGGNPPAPTSSVPVPPAVTVSTIYSTSEITITSCAPTVTNCPAGSSTVVTSLVPVSTTQVPVVSTPHGVPPAPSTSGVTVTPSVPAPTGVSPGSSSAPGVPLVTVITTHYTTTCPVTATITSGGSTITSVSSTVSTVTVTSTSTICTRCIGGETPAPVPTPTGVSPSNPEGEKSTTVITYHSVTTCPVTSTITAGSTTSTSVFHTVSTVTLTSTSTVPAVPKPTSPASSCPTVVPKCINTWLTLPKCTSNSDTSCFCPSSDFTKKVISCIQAWGASEAEIQAALSYFTGICASYVPSNPGILTVIPTTITLVPVPSPTGVSPVTGSAGGAKPSSAAPLTTITYSTYTVTVPQVGFSTASTGSTTTVGLVPGPAAPTGVSAGNTRIPNPWVASSTLVYKGTPTPTPSSRPSYTPILSNGAAKVGIKGMVGAGALFAIAVAFL